MEKIFPTIMIALQVVAAGPYFYSGNWRMGLYWTFAAGLTFVVTW